MFDKRYVFVKDMPCAEFLADVDNIVKELPAGVYDFRIESVECYCCADDLAMQEYIKYEFVFIDRYGCEKRRQLKFQVSRDSLSPYNKFMTKALYALDVEIIDFHTLVGARGIVRINYETVDFDKYLVVDEIISILISYEKYGHQVREWLDDLYDEVEWDKEHFRHALDDASNPKMRCWLPRESSENKAAE